MPKLTLHRKILLLGLLITLVYVGLTGLVLVGFIQRGFEEVETAQARKDLERARSILQNDLDQLTKACRDYAYWDELYRYLADRDSAFIDTNLGADIYGNLGLDFVRIIDADDRLIYEQVRNGGPFAPGALPAIELPRARIHGAARGPRHGDEAMAGLWLAGDGLLLAAAYPIRDNSQQGASRGVLIFARLLTPDYIRHLSAGSHLDFSISRLTPGELDREPLRDLGPDDNFRRIVHDEHHQDIYSLLDGMDGKPVATMTLVLPREVTQTGSHSTRLGLLTLAVGMAASLGALVWFTRRYVTASLRLMAGTVTRLAERDDGTTRVPVLSDDEIGTLAEQFNQLLGKNREMTRNLEQTIDLKTGQLHQANEALLLAGQVFDNVLESIVITDRQGVILRANPAFETLTGFTVAESLGCKANLMKSDRHPPDFYAEMWQQLTTGGHWQGEIWNRRKSGEIFPATLSITSLRNADGAITHYIGTLDDISMTKRNEERILHLAFHDPLTGLSNRALFADRTGTSLQRARRDGYQLALIVLDLDGFKQVNDTHGHALGDQLLIEVARQLQGVLRAEDTVARFGGDEFTALLPQIDSPQDAFTVAQKILAAIEQLTVVDDRRVQVSASIGISIYPVDGEDYASLFAAADAAMYRVKTTGKAGFRLAGEHA